MRLRDLIVAAGGARPEAYASIEIARMQEDGTSTQVLTANLDRAMAGGEKDNLLLADRDHVSVRNVRDARRAADVVEMKGEVKYPGFYPLLSKDERLSSVIARAGGLTEAAFAEGTIFNRQTLILLAEPQVQTAAEIQHSLKALTDQVRELEMAKYGVTAKSQPVVTTGTGAAAAAAGVAGAASAAAAPKAPLPSSASQTHRAVEDVTKTAAAGDSSAGLRRRAARRRDSAERRYSPDSSKARGRVRGRGREPVGGCLSRPDRASRTTWTRWAVCAMPTERTRLWCGRTAMLRAI